MKTLIIAITLLLNLYCFAQGIVITGDLDIDINSGSFMIVSNDGNFQLDNQNTDYTVPDISGTIKVSGDWINNTSNAIDLSGAIGLIIFNGSQSQLIDGDAKTIFEDVKLENDLGLDYNTDIAGTLDLSSGSMELNNYNLKIYDNADITNYSSSYNIISNSSGDLQRYLNAAGSEVIFPLATTTSYTPIYISQNSGTSGYFNVRLIDGVWSDGLSGDNLALTEPVVNRTWVIDSDVTPDASIILQWNASDEVNGFDREASLGANYSGQWNIVSATISGDGPYTAEFMDINSFDTDQAFTLSDNNQPLPVELISFELKSNMDYNTVLWETSSELNCKGFKVYSSVDNKNFNELGFVEGNGSSYFINSYNFKDYLAYSAKTIYYKLEQIDINGNSSFIAEGSLQNKTENVFSCFNLSDEGLKFISSEIAFNAELKIYSIDSKLIYNSDIQINNGLNKVCFNTGDLSKGIYLATICLDNGKRMVYKVNYLQTL